MVIRIIFITLTSLLFVPLLVSERNFLFSYISLGIIFLLQVLFLLRYVGKVNKNLENFFLTIREQNLSISFPDMSKDRTFIELNDYLHEINEIISRVRREKEVQRKYLQYVIDNVDVGIVAFTSENNVELWNKAASRIIGLNNLRITGQLETIEQGLSDFISGLKPGKEMLRKVYLRGQIIPLAFRASRFTIDGREISLVSFQNIKAQLEDNELDSWQKLIRVLTHEIMNSAAPLSSLSSTLNWRFGRITNDSFINDEFLLADTKNSLRIIESRSRGLIDFVGSYRRLTKIPELKISSIKIVELFHNVSLLMKDEAHNYGISLIAKISGSKLEIKADKNLIEQIMINLINNAIQSFQNQGEKYIELRCLKDADEQVSIQVANNGPSIPRDIMDKIFIPFFTTREKGTGIGLSFSRQVMRLHGGNILVSSSPGGETIFSLNF